MQDIENFVSGDVIDWDYINPRELFELLKESGVLEDKDKYLKAMLYCEFEGYSNWQDIVNDKEYNWDDDIYLYPNFDWYDLGRYFLHAVDCIEIPDFLTDYIDYEKYGEQFELDGFHEYEGGIIEIR